MNPNLHRKYHEIVAEDIIKNNSGRTLTLDMIRDNMSSYRYSDWIHYEYNIYLRIGDVGYKKFTEKDIATARILSHLCTSFSNPVFISPREKRTVFYVQYKSSVIGGIKIKDIEKFTACGFNVFEIIQDSLMIIYEYDDESDGVEISLEQLKKNNIEKIYHTVVNLGL